MLSAPFPLLSQRYNILLHILTVFYFESLNVSMIPPKEISVVLFQAGTSTEYLLVFTQLSPSLPLIGLYQIASSIHSRFELVHVPSKFA